jgi:hypothetical protein
MEPGSPRITAPTAPVQRIEKRHTAVHNERALLVNPRVDDPFLHLQWAPVDRSRPRKSWRWTINGLDPRGTMTIRTLDLEYRIDYVNRHLERMRPGWAAIDTDIAAGRPREAKATWDNLVSVYVDDPQQPFRNAAWWALDALYPEAERKKLGFSGFVKPCG